MVLSKWRHQRKICRWMWTWTLQARALTDLARVRFATARASGERDGAVTALGGGGDGGLVHGASGWRFCVAAAVGAGTSWVMTFLTPVWTGLMIFV